MSEIEDDDEEDFPLIKPTLPKWGTPEHDEYLAWLRDCGKGIHGSGERNPKLSSYRPEYALQAKKLYEKGWIDTEVAEFFGVCRETIRLWSMLHKEFGKSRKLGKEPADDRVEMAFYQRAIGYDLEVQKTTVDKTGKVHTWTEIEHYPPDPKAAMNWLKNRRSRDWKDRREVTGADGAPLNPVGPTRSKVEIARRILYHLQRGADEGGKTQIPHMIEEKVTIHE